MSHATDVKKVTGNGNRDVAEESSERFESLRTNFAELRNDVSQILSHLADAGKSGRDVAAGQVNRVVDAAKEKAGDVRDAGQDVLDSLSKQIRANPGTSALIAFGIGFLAAKMLRRG